MQNEEFPACKIVDVPGDGNCFYRSLQLLLGNDHKEYMVLKDLVYFYTQQNQGLAAQVGDVSDILSRIRRDK